MIESLAILASVITTIATEVFQKKIMDPLINKRVLQRELKEAIIKAIDNTSDNFAEFFYREKGGLDKYYWKRNDVVTQLWESLTDIKNTENIPDFNVLYEAYCDQYRSKVRIDRELFERALEEFWLHFLECAKNSRILCQFYLNKIIFQLDETVFPAEGRKMIREYCKKIDKKLEKRIFIKFRPIELVDDFPEEEIKREFFDYKPTQIVFIGNSEDHTNQIIENKGFQRYRKLIILGDGGIGKTRFMMELERKLVTDIATGNVDPKYLPIYIEANDFKSGTTDELNKLLITKFEGTFDLHKYTDRKLKGFVRYLKMYNMLFPLIDAFDQIWPERESAIYKMLSDDALFGKCRCYISTRPYRIEQLLRGIKDEGMDEKKFEVVEIKPFTRENLQNFFKDYYSSVIDHINKLDTWRSEEINLIQLPLFARLIKIMAMEGEFNKPQRIEINSQTGLIEMFVNFVIREQPLKDRDLSISKEEKEEAYKLMIDDIQKLSLKTLETGQIHQFRREFAKEILGSKGFRQTFPLMKKVQFIQHFIDYENEVSFEEEIHRYHHRIFQEYFAARELYRLYKKHDSNEIEKMRKSMEKMEYMFMVGKFFSDMIAQKTTDPKKDFYFWQSLLMVNNEDWVRTYALQVRDALGESKAKEFLEKLFDDENKKLICREVSDNMIRIPAGKFLKGSYENPREWPVRLIELDEYYIDKYLVTNEEYCKFLNDKKPDKMTLNKWLYFKSDSFYYDKCRIKNDGSIYSVEKGYERYPIIYVTWYGANAYAKWMGKKLPTETEWEKTARGIYGRKYPWGNNFDWHKCHNLSTSRHGGTTEVGSYPLDVSPYGCFDMAGNVSEWPEDCCEDVDNIYKEEGIKKIFYPRGGSWHTSGDHCSCTNRSLTISASAGYSMSVGFRCVKILK